MKKWLKNEHGLTLTELLATIVISSIILISITSAFVFVHKQYGSQTDNIEEQTDIAIALKSITNDARAAHTFQSDSNTTLILQTDDGDIIYTLEDHILKRNHVDYIYDIHDIEFNVSDENKLSIRIESNSGREVSTEIVKRGERNEEQ